MLRPYRELFVTRGAWVFSLAGFVARMPISMVGLGIVLLVSAVTGEYGLAGALSATFAFTQAMVSPQVARLVDRLGQARVTVPALAVFAAGLIWLLVLVEAGAPSWTLFASTAVAGAAMPPVGSLVRARWSHALRDSRRVHTAYSFESAVDELIFVVGPVLVTVLATQVGRLAGLLAVLVLAVGGTLAFAAHRVSEPPPSGMGHREDGFVLADPGLRVVFGSFIALGGFFGSFEVIVVAFASEQGLRVLSGVVLALYALGSFLAGLAYGTIRFRAPLHRRFRTASAFMALSVLPLLAVGRLGNLPVLAVLALVAGFSASPLLIGGFALVERLAPAARLTEGLTWAVTGVVLGVTAGASVSGWAIDRLGAGPAFAVPVVSGVTTALVAFAGTRWLGPRGPGREEEHGSADVA
ncbi:MAG: MFS transporter [Carbonactinosporaceae bacterium]